MTIDEHLLQDVDANLGDGGLFATTMRMKVGWPVGPRLLRVPVDVGQHRQDGGRVVPMLAAAGLGHHDELTERAGSGVDADDAGKFVHEAIKSLASRFTSSVASCRSA